jgi:hypothetical protein
MLRAPFESGVLQRLQTDIFHLVLVQERRGLFRDSLPASHICKPFFQSVGLASLQIVAEKRTKFRSGATYQTGWGERPREPKTHQSEARTARQEPRSTEDAITTADMAGIKMVGQSCRSAGNGGAAAPPYQNTKRHLERQRSLTQISLIFTD